MTKRRVITALWGIPLLVIIVWFGNIWIFASMISLAAALAIWEFNIIIPQSSRKAVTVLGMLWCVILIFAQTCPEPTSTVVVLTLGVVLSAIFFIPVYQPAIAFESWLKMICGVLYIGLPLSYYVAVRDLAQGKEWVMYIFFTTFACDTTAYFIGRKWGKKKLIPHISPGKTWEGAVAGFLSAIVASLLLNLILPLNMVVWQVVILGLLLGVFGQIGDLWESVIKRAAGIKDSGGLLPGHGGILDRADSLIFNGVVAYYSIIWLIV